MRTTCSISTRLALLAGLAVSSASIGQVVFYQQNFDGAVLNQQSGDPAVLAVCGNLGLAFTHVPPAGWTWNACGTATYSCRVGNPTCDDVPGNCGTCGSLEGVLEWEGWSFTPKTFWGVRTDNQQRQDFILGVGNVAVADADEWDDRGDPDQNCGTMNTWMGTPAISLSGVSLATLSLTFDSSWRPEGFDDLPDNNQTAIIRAYYTVGGVEQAAVEVMHWDSDSAGIDAGDYFKTDATNETVVLTAAFVDERAPGLQAPSGATAVRFEFGMVRAANDWWWAIDNVRVAGAVAGTGTTIFTEGFEGVTLLPPVHEVPTGCATTYCGVNTFTHTGPGGVVVSVDGPATGGVPDWRGWSFVERPFWNCVSGGNGSGFINSSGKLAVAEGDEFEDTGNATGPLDTTMTTPGIDLSSRSGNLVVLSFDSAWLNEEPQIATIVAQYNNGDTEEVLRWESAAGLFFKADAPNEQVAIAIDVPASATSVVLKFRYVAGNNWFWAIDNLQLFQGSATIGIASIVPSQSVMILAPTEDFAACTTPWSPTPPAGWTDVWNPIGGCPVECGRPEWRGWAFAFKDWWWQRVDDQQRSQFTKGRGIVAIADPDEWDDFANNTSNFNAFLTTPSISLPGIIGDASLTFDSSWRDEAFDDGCSCDPNPPASTIQSVSTGNPAVVTTTAPHNLVTGNYVTIAGSNSTPTLNGRVRIMVTGPTTFTVPAAVSAAGSAGSATRRNTNNQTAVVKAVYTVGGVDQPAVEVLRWDSDSGRTASGEQIFIAPSPFFHNDNTNESVTVPVSSLLIPSGATAAKFEFSLINARNDWWWAFDNLALSVNGSEIFSEDFEDVADLQGPPSELPPVAQCAYFSEVVAQGGNLTVDNSGLTNCAQGDDFYGFNAWLVEAWARVTGGERYGFLASTAFVSDFAARGCNGTAILATPTYSIGAINPGSLSMTFRSSWGSEALHNSRIEVSFDGGAWETALNWTTANKSTTPDEVVILNLGNPANSQTVAIRFVDRESGWWAVTELGVSGVVGSPCVGDYDGDNDTDSDDIVLFFGDFDSGEADVDGDNDTDSDDIVTFFTGWDSGC